ncbi:MAG: MFS transporter [Candidatus Eremiobacteraeota bacterium]|nr:MFS transporter [Candidatus Eremiobacteraeota bacterium]
MILFALAAGLSVANVYYAQPLLDALARDFGVAQAAVGGVVTATQLGCALALMFLVPLGDRMDRRRLMLSQLLGLVVALLVVATARATWLLLLGMLGVGLLGTAMTQGLIAYAARAAAEGEQGRVVGRVQGGVFLGLLLARVFSGAVSDLAGWRWVYGGSAVLMLLVALPLWRKLPVVPVTISLTYGQLVGSMVRLLAEDRVLRVRGLLALLMFADFNIFWSALVLPLSAEGFSHTAIGALGLVGAAGALLAARAGSWADRGYASRTTGGALVLLGLAWFPLFWMKGWLLLGILLLDAGGQALHVTNQSLIFRDRGEEHSRLVGLYMLFYSLGSGLGAMATTLVYARFGWWGVCVLGEAVSLLALVFWMKEEWGRRRPDQVCQM